jgi:hypothetical protein
MPASQAAEKRTQDGKKCQGTTSVVPQVAQNKQGLQPRAVVVLRLRSSARAFSAACLAADRLFSMVSPEIPSFSVPAISHNDW